MKIKKTENQCPLQPLDFTLQPSSQWEFLFQQTLLFAEYQVRRLRWRHQDDGILPGGFDPNSIAAQAIMEFLQQCPEPPSDLQPILWEIKRLVLKHVTRLHHLKENWLLSNQADLALVRDQDGDLVSPLELLPAPDVQPDEALIRKESLVEYHQTKFRFEVFLAKERRLITLFELNCDGISKPQTLAARLKLGVRTIENLQKRLRRKWLAFSRPGSAGIRAGAMKPRPPANGSSVRRISDAIVN
jgi:hypothetical protein